MSSQASTNAAARYRVSSQTHLGLIPIGRVASRANPNWTTCRVMKPKDGRVSTKVQISRHNDDNSCHLYVTWMPLRGNHRDVASPCQIRARGFSKTKTCLCQRCE